jgi:hypothetical protein
MRTRFEITRGHWAIAGFVVAVVLVMDVVLVRGGTDS